MGAVPHLKFHVQPEGWDIPMTDHTGAGIYGVPWIPSIYPLYVSINIPAPWICHGIYFRRDSTRFLLLVGGSTTNQDQPDQYLRMGSMCVSLPDHPCPLVEQTCESWTQDPKSKPHLKKTWDRNLGINRLLILNTDLLMFFWSLQWLE